MTTSVQCTSSKSGGGSKCTALAHSVRVPKQRQHVALACHQHNECMHGRLSVVMTLLISCSYSMQPLERYAINQTTCVHTFVRRLARLPLRCSSPAKANCSGS
jgi:N-acetyl-gamma-glutamylphosphate reductase